jgi:hypothetical protein
MSGIRWTVFVTYAILPVSHHLHPFQYQTPTAGDQSSGVGGVGKGQRKTPTDGDQSSGVGGVGNGQRKTPTDGDHSNGVGCVGKGQRKTPTEGSGVGGVGKRQRQTPTGGDHLLERSLADVELLYEVVNLTNDSHETLTGEQQPISSDVAEDSHETPTGEQQTSSSNTRGEWLRSGTYRSTTAAQRYEDRGGYIRQA